MSTPTFVVPRPAARKGTLAQRLEELGVSVWDYPCIHTHPITPCPSLTDTLERLGDHGWVAFSSPVGVNAFFHALGPDTSLLDGVNLAAIGPSTASALEKLGWKAHYVPPVSAPANLGQGLPAEGKVLLPLGSEGSPLLTQALSQRGIPYEEVTVYATRYEHPQAPQLRQALEQGEGFCVPFTSVSTSHIFADNANAEQLHSAQKQNQNDYGSISRNVNTRNELLQQNHNEIKKCCS